MTYMVKVYKREYGGVHIYGEKYYLFDTKEEVEDFVSGLKSEYTGFIVYEKDSGSNELVSSSSFGS